MTSSASESILTVMIAARERTLDTLCGAQASLEVRRQATGNLVCIACTNTHSSTEKAARIPGVSFVAVPASESTGYAMDGEAFAAEVERCEAEGLCPFFVTATLGTTATCAIDDLDGIASVIRSRENTLWGHVDASYAGAALICPEYAHLSRSINGFNSFNVNLNKWLLVNLDASCLFVGSKFDLYRSLSCKPSYLRAATDSDKVPGYELHELSITLSRRFRALKVWFVLRTYGTSKLADVVRKGIDFGEDFAEMLLTERDTFELLTPPQFGLVVFKMINGHEHRKNLGHDRSNALTRRLVTAINTSGSLYVTGCQVGPSYAVRFVTSHQGTSESSIAMAFELIRGLAVGLRQSEEASAMLWHLWHLLLRRVENKLLDLEVNSSRHAPFGRRIPGCAAERTSKYLLR